MWYQHLAPCLVPAIHRLPASLHPGLVPSLAAHSAAHPPTGTVLLPSTAFWSQIQAQQQDAFTSSGGMPSFQAKGTREVWPKETAAPFQLPWQCRLGAAVTCSASQTTKLLERSRQTTENTTEAGG